MMKKNQNQKPKKWKTELGESVDCSPKWKGIVQICIDWLQYEQYPSEKKFEAREYLMYLAKEVDKLNAKAKSQGEEVPFQTNNL